MSLAPGSPVSRPRTGLWSGASRSCAHSAPARTPGQRRDCGTNRSLPFDGEPPDADAGGDGVPAGGAAHQGVSPGSGGPQPGTRHAHGLHRARHRSAAHARPRPGGRVNVGLAAPDRDEMVYLESIRYNRRPSLRRVVSGLRRPRRTHWAELEPALTAAIHEVEEKGLLCRRLVNPAAQAELRILHNAGHIVCSFPRTGTSGPTCVQMVTALGARR